MLNSGWDDKLDHILESTSFKDFMIQIADDYSRLNIYPKRNNIFRAFDLCDYQDVKVVILGQDPYFNEGQADGLAFSVDDGQKLPPSLRNIFKEIESDLGIKNTGGNLESWARQGVFLLNTSLTVEEKKPNSYKNSYWKVFTDEVIRVISEREDVVFILLGNHAIEKKKLIKNTALVLESSHPSPLGAYRGFLGSRIFSRANDLLKNLGKEIINWKT